MSARRFTFGDADLPGAFNRPAVAVGVFDGVHRGHEQVISTLRRWADEPDAPVDTVLITFADHPRKVLTGHGPDLLTSLEHRLLLLERRGLTGVVVLPFDSEMASWSPEEFVQRVLVDSLRASRVLVGANHRFGKDRAGDFDLLQALGQRFDFDARVLSLKSDDRVISSTAIREAIVQGDLDAASRLLGRPVSVFGEVVTGEQRGRTIGFPTANLDLHHSARPPGGVYAVRARILGGDERLSPAVANIGRRPTFHPEQGRDLVEVHLLEGGGDLYGKTLEVQFVSKLRDERRFTGATELAAQIKGDIAQALELLAGLASS